MTPNLKTYPLVSTTKDSIGMSGTNPAASNQVLTGTSKCHPWVREDKKVIHFTWKNPIRTPKMVKKEGVQNDKMLGSAGQCCVNAASMLRQSFLSASTLRPSLRHCINACVNGCANPFGLTQPDWSTTLAVPFSVFFWEESTKNFIKPPKNIFRFIWDFYVILSFRRFNSNWSTGTGADHPKPKSNKADREKRDLRPSNKGAWPKPGQRDVERHDTYHTPSRVGDPTEGEGVRWNERCVIVVHWGECSNRSVQKADTPKKNSADNFAQYVCYFLWPYLSIEGQRPMFQKKCHL